MGYLENESYRMDECNLNDESPGPQQGIQIYDLEPIPLGII